MSNSEAVFRGLKEPTCEDILEIVRENLEFYVPLAQKVGWHKAADEIAERSFDLLRDMLKDDSTPENIKEEAKKYAAKEYE